MEHSHQSSRNAICKSEELYRKLNLQLGIANIKSAYGDLHRVQGKMLEAICSYKEALVMYSELDTIQGIELSKIEILEIEFSQLREEERRERLKELEELNRKTLSRYSYKKRIELQKKLQR